MIMRIVIAGCRNYTDYKEAKSFIEAEIIKLKKENQFVLLSGKCKGADQLGERFAKENGWNIEEFPAEWRKYGRAAGPKRNKTMVEKCDAIICFWDGKSKGTASLIQFAKQMKKTIAIKMV